MTDIKVRARLLIKGKIMKLWIKSILPFAFFVISMLTFAVPLLFVFYGTKEVLPYLEKNTAYIAVAALFIISVFMFLFALIRKCYSEANVFFLLDKNGTAPESYFRFSQGVRYMRMKILVMFYNLLWGTVFMFPSFFLFYVLFAGIYGGSMIKSIFVTLTVSGILLFLCGAAFFYTVCSRYFLCEYLFYLYPLSPVRSLVFSSVLLSRQKLLYITKCRLSLLPWRIFGIFGFTGPFARVFVKCIKAVLAESIYGEKKCAAKKPAVVFYINRHSVFVPNEGRA